jgi:hypothetical protein
MKMHINEDELKLLAHLHEKAGGCGASFAIPANRVATALEVNGQGLRSISSYLAEHQLVGFADLPDQYFTFPNRTPRTILGLYLTGNGENYMRALEAEPRVGKKVTLGILKELGTSGKSVLLGVAGQLLAEFVKHHHG